MTAGVLSVRHSPLPSGKGACRAAVLGPGPAAQAAALSEFAGGPFGLSVHPVLLGCCIELVAV